MNDSTNQKQNLPHHIIFRSFNRSRLNSQILSHQTAQSYPRRAFSRSRPRKLSSMQFWNLVTWLVGGAETRASDRETVHYHLRKAIIPGRAVRLGSCDGRWDPSHISSLDRLILPLIGPFAAPRRCLFYLTGLTPCRSTTILLRRHPMPI